MGVKYIDFKNKVELWSLEGLPEDVKSNYIEVDDSISLDDIKAIDENGKPILYTPEEKAQLEREKFNHEIIQEANHLVNVKLQQIKEELSGIPGITQEQIERYQAKYKLAVEYTSTTDANKKAEIESIFKFEADLKGQKVADYIAYIKELGDKWNATLDLAASLIDSFRVIFKQKVFSGENEETLRGYLAKVETITLQDITPDILVNIFKTETSTIDSSTTTN